MTDLQKTTIRAMVNIFESGRIHGDYGAIAVMKGRQRPSFLRAQPDNTGRRRTLHSP